MPLCCDLCAVHRSVRQFHLNEQFNIIEDAAINQIFKNLKNETIEEIEKFNKLKRKMKNNGQIKKNEDKNEKNGKIQRKNTKLKKPKKLKIYIF